MAEEALAPLVWLPFDPADLGEPVAGLRIEQVPQPGARPAETLEQVAFYVPPYKHDPADLVVPTRMPSLRVVQSLWAGVDAIRPQVPAGVTLCSGRGIHDAVTAELALTLALSALRGVPDFVRAGDEARWAPQDRPSLADRRVLIVGYGAIGAAIEDRLLPFETEVVRVARRPRPGVHGIEELPGLLPEVDVVILVLPLTTATRGLVDEEFLAAMRPGALLVNVARGAVVETDALLRALARGHVSAALDVTDPEPLPADHPLWQAPNLLITPHVGGDSAAMWPRAYRLVRAQLARFAAGEDLANVVTGEY